MKTTFTVIASAFRGTLTTGENLDRHIAVQNDLIAMNMCDYKVAVGVYHEDGMPEPSREVSLMINGLAWSEVKACVELYCNDYQQDCILVMNEETGACVLMHTDWNDSIGTWTQVTKDEALESGIYTVDTACNYFMAK